MEKDNVIKSNVITEESEIKKKIISIIKGCAISIILSIIFLTIFALLLTYTTLPESTIIPVVLTITGVSILAGSANCSRKIKKNGLLYGGVVGFTYVFILYLASSICLTGFSLSTNSFIMLAVGLITGIIGGIVGVNMAIK